MKEYHAFCLWKKHEGVLKDIYENFDVVADKKFNFNPEERAKKVRAIYEIFIVGKDERIWSKEEIRIIVVCVNADYGIRTTAGTKNTRFVNKEVFDFKKNVRERHKVNFKYIHATDHVLEANKVFKAFGLKEYLSDFTMVDLKKTKGVIWNVCPFTKDNTPYENTDNYDFTSIHETSHYKYLNGNKTQYLKYIADYDKKHSDYKNYEKLINNFNYKNYNSSEPKNLIKVANIDNDWIVIDGLHRASILLKNFKNLEQVCIRVKIKRDHLYRSKK